MISMDFRLSTVNLSALDLVFLLQMLHTYTDGSILKCMSAKELTTIPVWKGNRILDQAHATAIKNAIGSNVSRLDSGYSIIKYQEIAADNRLIMMSYLIDGQHRASVIRDFYRDTVCEPDFQVTVTERIVESESDAVEYFNTINNVKCQFWKTDVNLLVNKYIQKIENVINTNKKSLTIRPGPTCRPYLSSDRLREVLKQNSGHLKHSSDEIDTFIKKLVQKNKDLILKFQLDITQPNAKDMKLKERAIAINFALAYDASLRWIRELLVL